MIDREYIIKAFEKDEVSDAIKIYEKFKLSYEKNITVFSSSFCTPNIWGFFSKHFNSKNFLVETNGIFDESERRLIAFNNFYGSSYPITVLEIENKSNFSALVHKDYLGGIMSLGIEREKIGDILVKGDRAFVPVCDEICSYIYSNLVTIGRNPVEVNVVKDYSKIPPFDFKEETVIVASLRLDNFVAKIANISRSKSIELIDSGKILINYVRTRDKSKEITKDTRITIRGIGKFIIGDIVGETKSGKQRVVIKKYT